MSKPPLTPSLLARFQLTYNLERESATRLLEAEARYTNALTTFMEARDIVIRYAETLTDPSGANPDLRVEAAEAVEAAAKELEEADDVRHEWAETYYEAQQATKRAWDEYGRYLTGAETS